MDIDENEHFTENLSSSDSFKADDEQGKYCQDDSRRILNFGFDLKKGKQHDQI